MKNVKGMVVWYDFCFAIPTFLIKKNWISNVMYFDQELEVEMYRNCMFHLCSLAYVGPELFIQPIIPPSRI